MGYAIETVQLRKCFGGAMMRRGHNRFVEALPGSVASPRELHSPSQSVRFR